MIVPGRRAAGPLQMHNAIGAGTPTQCGFDLVRAGAVYPDIITLQVSARSGEGLEGWYDWLTQEIASARKAVKPSARPRLVTPEPAPGC